MYGSAGDDPAAWENSLAALAERIARGTERGDWNAIAPLITSYTRLLHEPPGLEPARLGEAFSAAQTLIRQVQQKASNERDKTGRAVRELGRGRKAVAAYR